LLDDKAGVAALGADGLFDRLDSCSTLFFHCGHILLPYLLQQQHLILCRRQSLAQLLDLSA